MKKPSKTHEKLLKELKAMAVKLELSKEEVTTLTIKLELSEEEVVTTSIKLGEAEAVIRRSEVAQNFQIMTKKLNAKDEELNAKDEELNAKDEELMGMELQVQKYQDSNDRLAKMVSKARQQLSGLSELETEPAEIMKDANAAQEEQTPSKVLGKRQQNLQRNAIKKLDRLALLFLAALEKVDDGMEAQLVTIEDCMNELRDMIEEFDSGDSDHGEEELATEEQLTKSPTNADAGEEKTDVEMAEVEEQSTNHATSDDGDKENEIGASEAEEGSINHAKNGDGDEGNGTDMAEAGNDQMELEDDYTRYVRVMSTIVGEAGEKEKEEE